MLQNYIIFFICQENEGVFFYEENLYYLCSAKHEPMNNPKTERQFHEVLAKCRQLFNDKMKDYGPAWRILRTPSVTDQIYIKVKRIRTLQTEREHLVDEGIEPEFIGIVNYAAMGVIQLQLGVVDKPDLSSEEATALYDKVTQEAYELMARKNHDYDEAWRDMRVSSITDLIMSKVLRTKSIEDNGGKTLVSEGLDANYYDMINYAVFALILLSEQKEQ